MVDRSTVLVLTGPTASGKSTLAYDLCRLYPDQFELISVDSAQVYRGLDIGSAKPSVEERSLVPHHLIDIRDPEDPYTAHDFVAEATRCIKEIQARGKKVLMVGGTMLYLRSLREGLADLPSASPTVRAALEAEAEVAGWQALHDRLRAVDPTAADRIRPTDRQRLQRALEVFELTGESLTSLQSAALTACPFELVEVAIFPEDRRELHKRIEQRFDQMLDAGFVEEVAALRQSMPQGEGLPAMKSVGYRQIWAYLEGQFDWHQMRSKAVIATRQLAKRQITWLRSWPHVSRLQLPTLEALLKIEAVDHIVSKG